MFPHRCMWIEKTEYSTANAIESISREKKKGRGEIITISSTYYLMHVRGPDTQGKRSNNIAYNQKQ